MRVVALIFFLFLLRSSSAQTLGGNTVFSFLNMPNTPQLSALGGINVSSVGNDVGMAFNNPGLLKASMHTQLNAVFTSQYGGISNYHLSLGYRHEKLQTNFLWGLNFIDYGTITQTDASGNSYGDFRPNDWVMQIAASRNYLEKWRYGATLKFINSNYGQYKSNGIAVDVGVVYDDTSHLFTASVLAKNMGTQIKKYDGTDPDDLPFDLQVGITKRLRNSPFGFSFTAHHLHQFDLSYNDTSFNNANGFSNTSDNGFTFDKLFRHFVIAGNIYIADMVQLDIGYNYLRRKELTIGNTANGLTGFSIGVYLLLDKLQIRYARSHYQNNTAYNQFGLNLPLNRYFGLGPKTR